jgi:hypothetical protein
VPPPRRDVPVDVLRAAARRAVDERGLREVARAVGMSGSGFSKFLRGSVPRAGTRRKLVVWHAREAAETGELSPEAAEAVLSLLLDGLAEPRRARVLADVLARVEAEHRGQGTLAPEWLRRLREDG